MKKKGPARSKAVLAKTASSLPVEASFSEVVDLITAARHRAYQTINTGLMELYWQIGEYISRKLQTAEWGDGVVDELACYLARTQPGLKGFTRRNLFRMRQFYETYRADEEVSALLTQLPWTHHLSIMTATKRPEEREFYLRMAVQERWTSRELDRQIKGALFERAVLNPAAGSAAVAQTHPGALTLFKDAYVVEFLDLPDHHSESDLHRALVGNLGRFLTELGRDFCFIGSEYPAPGFP